jgi:ubiquitin-conjugating enzyme E2 G2
MASTTAQRRLLQEYRALTNNPPEGITAGPVSEDDLLYWEALIQGPEGTPFEGGIFPAELKFPKDYPLAPPSMRFLGEVWHPNGEFFIGLVSRVLLHNLSALPLFFFPVLELLILQETNIIN